MINKCIKKKEITEQKQNKIMKDIYIKYFMTIDYDFDTRILIYLHFWAPTCFV